MSEMSVVKWKKNYFETLDKLTLIYIIDRRESPQEA